MPPKTPRELKEQIDAQNAERPADADDTSRTSEGLKVPNPSRNDFFGNLAKVSESDTPEAEQ
jgi:hypothetical protein